jgi:hypothetical protein
MARNESRALAGYYPFPAHLLPAVASLVAPCAKAAQWSNTQPLKVLDPCAGTGEALLGLCSVWRYWQPDAAPRWRDKRGHPAARSPTFQATMIELDLARQAIAFDNVQLAAANGIISTESQVLAGDATRWGRKGDSRWIHLLYLNPPYDTHPSHRREEAAWLLRWLPQMLDGGVLVAVFPAAALDACADILARSTKEGQMFFRKLPAADFAAYQQVVIVAAVSSVEIPRPARAQAVREFGEFAEDLLPDLEVEAKPLVQCPVPRFAPVGTWSYRAVKPEDVAPLIRPLERVRGVDVPVDQMVGQRVALAMPPRPSHIVMALVDGAFDGQVIRSPRPGLPAVLVKAISGRQVVTVSEEEREDSEGKEQMVTKYVEIPSLKLYVMDLDTYQFIEPPAGSLPSGATALGLMNIADFVLAYAEPLAELMAQLFEPLHPVEDAQLIELPPFERTLFPAQHHAVSAVFKLFCRHPRALLMAEIGTGKTSMATQVWGSLRPQAAMDVLGPNACFVPRARIVMELEALGFDTSRLPSVERMLVMCPPHLVRSWAREIAASLPTARVVEVMAVSDLLRPADVYVLSRERAKLSHGLRGMGAGFEGGRLPGSALALTSRRIGAEMVCPKCGGRAVIQGWKRKRAQRPDDLADARATCGHVAPPRTPLWRALDFCAQMLSKWDPLSPAGLWATQHHPQIGRRLVLLQARAEAAERAADPSWKKENGEPSLSAFVPKLGGGMRSLSGAVKVVLRAIGATLAEGYDPDAPWELTPAELAKVLEELGRAASAAGWSPEDYRAEVIRRAFRNELDADGKPKTSKEKKLHPKLSHWQGAVMAPLARNYLYQGVGSPLTIWSTLWVQLHALAVKTGGAGGAVCGERLYCAEPKPRRYSIARWMSRYMPATWWSNTLLAIDEAHEMSNGETAQSLAGQRLAGRAGAVLLLTGSLMSGYARSLFHVLRMASPDFAEEWRYADEARFVERYGYSKFREVADVVKATARRGRQSDRKQTTSMTRTGDAPGVAPGAVLRYVLPVAAVVHQEDLELSIPPMFEHEVQVPVGDGDIEMLDEWQRIEGALVAAMQDMKKRRKLLWAMLKVPTFPDLGCEDVDPFVIAMPEDEDQPDLEREIIVVGQLQPASYVTPKERWLLQFLAEQRAEGRRSLVFVSHTGGGYPSRLLRLLAGASVSAQYLDVKRVPAKDRDAWIEAKCGEVEVLICNPNAVRTGLNSLVAFSNAVWMEADYDARTYRQANGRIHRIGQVLPAHVYYLYIANSSQADAKALIAAKVDASIRVDGLDTASSLAMAGASESDKAAQAVYQDVAQMIYNRTVERRAGKK